VKNVLTPQVFEYSIPFSELDISPEKVLKFIKSGNKQLDEFSHTFLEEFLSAAGIKAEVKGGFAYIPAGYLKVAGTGIVIDTTEFYSQKIITARLRKADSAALFAVTAGAYFEDYSKKLISEGDTFSGYLVDAAASETAEAAAEWIELKIEEFASNKSLKITRRYSPGYCGWNVEEQHKLFSFFPAGFCGIKLTESALMLPIKSVSGIIGMGANVKKEEYECAVCEEENCFRRNI
jgi:hypothetical protein